MRVPDVCLFLISVLWGLGLNFGRKKIIISIKRKLFEIIYLSQRPFVYFMDTSLRAMECFNFSYILDNFMQQFMSVKEGQRGNS